MLNFELQIVRRRRQEQRRVFLHNVVTEHINAKALAAKLEVTQTTVQRWLDGESRIPQAAIIAIEALLGRLPGMDTKHWQSAGINSDGTIWVYGMKRAYTPDMIPGLEEANWRLRNALEMQDRRVKELEARIESLARPAVLASANDAIAPSFSDLRPTTAVMGLADVSLNPRTKKAQALKKA